MIIKETQMLHSLCSDKDTGGGHMRKVQMGDRAEACKVEKIGSSDTHVLVAGHWAEMLDLPLC